jgi:hypothetical protein
VLLDGMGSVIFFLNSYIPSTSGSLTLALHRLSYIGRLGWPLLHAFLLFWFLHILNGTACRWGRRLLVVGIVMGVVQLLMDVLPWIWFRLDIDWGESTAWKRIYLYEFWAYLGLMGAAFVYLRLRLIRV